MDRVPNCSILVKWVKVFYILGHASINYKSRRTSKRCSILASTGRRCAAISLKVWSRNRSKVRR